MATKSSSVSASFWLLVLTFRVSVFKFMVSRFRVGLWSLEFRDAADPHTNLGSGIAARLVH